MAILVGRFIIANRNLKVQYDSLSRVKSLYETNATRDMKIILIQMIQITQVDLVVQHKSA